MDKYIVFDLETTGLNSKKAEIIEIAAIKVCGSNIIGTFCSFVHPETSVPAEATAVNGITNEMLVEAPAIDKVLPVFVDFVEDHCLVGHNITTFDLPIIQRLAKTYLGYELKNPYIDTLQIAKVRMGFLPNKKLTTIAAYFTIDTSHAHRALDDCRLTKECYEKMLELPECHSVDQPKHKHHPKRTDQTKALQTLHGFLMGIISDNVLTEAEVFALKKWLSDNSNLSGQYPFDRVFAVVEKALEDGVLEQCELDEMLSLFKAFTDPTSQTTLDSASTSIAGKNICLTGDFAHGERKYIQQIITEHGGIYRSSVTGRTDYVVVGALGSPDWSYGNYGSKVQTAMELIGKGKGIQVLKEDDFFSIIESEE